MNAVSPFWKTLKEQKKSGSFNKISGIHYCIMQLQTKKKSMALQVQTTVLQNIFRILLGAFMILAAIGHLSFQRAEFQAQVRIGYHWTKTL